MSILAKKQNEFQQRTAPIDCSNRRKAKMKEIVKKYNNLKNVEDKIRLFLSSIYWKAFCQGLKTVHRLIILTLSLQLTKENEMSENTASVISAVASALSAIAAWGAILYGCWKDRKQQEQSKKQQEIIDKQNTFLQTTTRIDCLNRRKEKLEEIIKEYNKCRQLEEQIRLLFSNRQYFIGNQCFADLLNAKREAQEASKRWSNLYPDNNGEPRIKAEETDKAYRALIEEMHLEISRVIIEIQTKINQLEDSFMRE